MGRCTIAKPQLEDGHTRIANEILEHLIKMHLAPNQWQVLLCIIRKTYGFQKKVDYIANSQICEATNLCKAVVSRCLSGLDDMKLIDRKSKYVGFQKDWEQWKLAVSSTLDTNQELAIQSTIGSKLAVQQTLVNNKKLAISTSKVSSSLVSPSPLPPIPPIPPTPLTKETIQKKEYGEFNNVFLTDEEYQKLKDKFGAGVTEKIEVLSTAIASKGYTYKSHYATILNWAKRDEKGTKWQANPQPYPSQGKQALPTDKQLKEGWGI